MYDKYAENMMLLCYRYIPNKEDAKEVLLDAFYNFFKNIKGFTYQGDGSTRAWLKKIVMNQCLMHLRKKKMEFVTDPDGRVTEDISFNNNIIEGLSVKEIVALIHGLPDGYRTIFNLYVFDGKGHKEIADLLGISENTSKSQLHKAKALLQKKLAVHN